MFYIFLFFFSKNNNNNPLYCYGSTNGKEKYHLLTVTGGVWTINQFGPPLLFMLLANIVSVFLSYYLSNCTV